MTGRRHLRALLLAAVLLPPVVGIVALAPAEPEARAAQSPAGGHGRSALVGAPLRARAAGETWQRLESPAGGAVTALDAISPDEVWLATIRHTSGTAIYRRHQGAWEEMVYYDDRGIDDLQMLSADDGWFVGYHWDSAGFTPSALAVRYHDGAFDAQVIMHDAWALTVEMVSPSDGWAAGGRGLGPDLTFAEGVIWRLENGQWRTDATLAGQAVVDIDMVGPGEGWAIGMEGALLHHAAGAWTEVRPPAAVALSGIDMIGTDEGWAGGGDGRWLHYHDGAWHVVETGLAGHVRRVRMVSRTEGWATGVDANGLDGLVLRFRDGGWQRETAIPDGVGALYALDLVGSSVGWAGGQESDDAIDVPGVVLHYGSELPTPTPSATPAGTTEYDGLYTVFPDDDDQTFWQGASQSTLAQVWDNNEDEIYAELLKG